MNLTLVRSEQFNGVICDFYRDKANEIWMTREQIGMALEYENPDDAIYHIHKRHQDRLDQFSVLDRLTSTDGKQYNTRVYSPKGVYEICRWSRQPKADAFMDFVWDVIEALRTGQLVNDRQVLRQLQAISQRLEILENKLNQTPVQIILPQPPPDLVDGHPRQRTRVRIRCAIDLLPDDLKAEVDRMVDDNTVTYADISRFLKDRGHSISKSAIGTYAQKRYAKKLN